MRALGLLRFQIELDRSTLLPTLMLGLDFHLLSQSAGQLLAYCFGDVFGKHINDAFAAFKSAEMKVRRLRKFEELLAFAGIFNLLGREENVSSIR